MSYQALYRQYRPQTFDEVIGQEHIVTTLINQINSKRIGHAYLFTGSRGIGKTTCARIFASEINGGIGYPIEIDAASNNGVDNVRNIIQEASERSLVGKYKTIIIDEAQAITPAGWGAFLKSIEETPEYCLEILYGVDSNNFKLALDTGHVNLYAPNTKVTDWIKAYGNNLYHMHIHNNYGKNDDHSNLSDGTLDFKEIFECIKETKVNPSFVFEMYNEDDIIKSYQVFKENNN